MTNKELLERCAKVMSIKAEWNGETETFERPVPFRNYLNYEPWNPLTSVADAADMAIKMKVDVMWAPRNNTLVARQQKAEIGYAVSIKDHPTEQAAYCYAVCSVVAQIAEESIGFNDLTKTETDNSMSVRGLTKKDPPYVRKNFNDWKQP